MLIVDDVYRTGQTMEAVAKAAKEKPRSGDRQSCTDYSDRRETDGYKLPAVASSVSPPASVEAHVVQRPADRRE